MSKVQKASAAGLVFFEGQEKPRQYVIFHRATVRGQCPMEVFTTSSLQLEYSFLDKEQCEIWQENGKWFFRNLSEEVFTFVGGKNVAKGQTAALTDGCVIRMVNERMLTAVFFEDYVSGRDWRILNMDDGRHTVKIEKQGEEGSAAALTFTFENGHWIMEEFLAEDVWHNNEPVNDKVKIRIDDIIRIGDTRFVFEGSGLVYGYPIQDNSLSINIDERSVHKAMKKVTLLKDINLSIEPGNMVLILGGSGAGKSTFVNAVTGYEKADATIREGSIDYYRDYDKVKYRIGFVPQENLMREEDTVGSTVKNAADMRLPADMGAEEKDRRIKAVLETFGLSGREKELVSKLSGGQKKRLSICTEFIAEPSLFILDEPDSGLDGIMATELMENLRMIACSGKIVLVITHAPDRVAHLFDKVIVLAKSSETKVGQLAFYGGIQEARDFFGVDTMEDVVKRINAKNEGGEGRADEYIEKYKAYSAEREKNTEAAFEDADRSEEPENFFDSISTVADTGGQARYKSRLEQIPVYLGKQFRLMINERNWKVFPMAAVIAFLVVYVLGDKMFRNMEFTKYGSLAVVCVCIWNGMFNSIQVVCKERSIIKREHRAGLHITSYMASHVIYQAIVCIIQVIITLVIFKVFGMYFPEGGLMTGIFVLDLAIAMFLITFAADMLALMVSCIAHTTTTAMTIMPFLLVVQLVFAGGIFPLQRAGSKFISLFMVSNWGINAVNIAADDNSQNSIILTQAIETMKGDGSDELMTRVHDVLALEDVQDKLEKYTASMLQEPKFAYNSKNFMKCLGILVLFSLIYIMLGIGFLEFIDKDKR